MVDRDITDTLLAEVIARYAGSAHQRLREITESAVRHLHAFATDVHLRHDEWLVGIRFLTVAGQISDDVRQELILLSDTLGLSALVEILTHEGANQATQNTVLGPFYVSGSPERPFGATMLDDPDLGERVLVRGLVTSVNGSAVGDARLDVWQNATSGFYACQQPGQQSPNNLRGVYRTEADGRYEIRTVRPVPYPIPDDGPAGQLLKANNRNWWRPGHIHMRVTAPGHRELTTHLFDTDSDYLSDDAVFGFRPGLARRFDAVGGELTATFDIVLDPLSSDDVHAAQGT